MTNYELVKKIHERKCKISLAITGGGTEAIGQLLRPGGGTNTLVEALVPYAPETFARLLGGEPDKFVSEEAACSMATAIWVNNMEFCSVGIGATSSLYKKNERTGREHNVFIATHHLDHMWSTSLRFEELLPRTEQEQLVSLVILNEIALACGIEEQLKIFPQVHIHRTRYESNISYLLSGTVPPKPHNFNTNSRDTRTRLIFPGSFNPLHEGHIRMAHYASKITGMKVDFEISVRNIEKPILSHYSLSKRKSQFDLNKDEDFIRSLLITNTPTFLEKVRQFPNSTFIVGSDTMNRISEAELDGMGEFVDFIVFPRTKTKKWPDRSNIKVVSDEDYKNLNIDGISSSAIRSN